MGIMVFATVLGLNWYYREGLSYDLWYLVLRSDWTYVIGTFWDVTYAFWYCGGTELVL
jgi:hypothetical protein